MRKVVFAIERDRIWIPRLNNECAEQAGLVYVEGEPVGIHLPPTVVLEVVEADPVVKGQTAASSYKPAKLSNGVKTSVPPFIETGEKIVVRTDDGSYVERFKG